MGKPVPRQSVRAKHSNSFGAKNDEWTNYENWAFAFA